MSAVEDASIAGQQALAPKTQNSQAAEVRTHPDFDPSDADITIRSSDGVLFRLHRKNLETHTGAFPGAEFVLGADDITLLTEPSGVLELLFKFVYPRRQPDLDDLSFEEALGLAEAVEKYEVFGMMKLCEIRLRHFVPQHASEILHHAYKHDYPKLVEDCIPVLARLPLLEVLEKLPFQYVLPWCRYHEAWRNIFLSSIDHLEKHQYAQDTHIAWVVKLERMRNLAELETALQIVQGRDDSPPWDSSERERRHSEVQDEVTRRIREGIKAMPSFIHFLEG